MHTDIIDLINAIRTAQEDNKQPHKEQPSSPYNVTISRSCSSKGKEIAAQVAQQLKLRLLDKQILDEIARLAEIDAYVMEHIDQHFDDEDDWLSTLLGNKQAERNLYQRNLVKTVLSAAQLGGVFLGRGANLVLARQNAFRVRIVASIRSCALEYAQQQEIAYEKAYQHIASINKHRANYIQKIFGADIDNMLNYDICINTDQFSVAQATQLIVQGLHIRHHPNQTRTNQHNNK